MQKVHFVGTSPDALFVDSDGKEYRSGETVEVSNEKAKELTGLGYAHFEEGEAPKTAQTRLVRRDTKEGDVRYVDPESGDEGIVAAQDGTTTARPSNAPDTGVSGRAVGGTTTGGTTATTTSTQGVTS